MKLRSKWALIRVAAIALLLIAVIGVRHYGDTHGRAGPVHLAAVTRAAASPTAEVELAWGGRVEETPATRLVSIAGTVVDPHAEPTAGALGSLTSTSFFLPESESAGADHPATDIQRLHALKASLNRHIRTMRAPAGSGPAALACPQRAYDLADLDRVAEAGLADLMSLIPIQAEPLRAFVRASYPKLSGVEVPYECFSRGGLVSSLVADDFLSEVESLHDRFAQQPAITIDLFIKSRPPGGSYILRSIHTDVGRVENTTNSTARAYRGVYDFSVTRAGYKPAHLNNIDLINSTPHLMECQLRTVKDADESTCQLR